MLISSSKLLSEARKASSCIPAFNFYNLETAQAIFTVAKKAKRPVIAAFGEGYLGHASLEVIAGIVKTLAKEHPYPMVLHLDHCQSPDVIHKAIEAGFTSVMYDGSRLPLEENIKNTRAIVDYAHQENVSVEGELGYLNPEDGSASATDQEQDGFTNPAEALRFVTETGVDSLAVAIGNAHGLYKGVPELNIQRLTEIYNAVGIPLVLHGCSGIPAIKIQEAVSIAVAKININTELALAGSKGMAQLMQQDPNVRMEKLMLKARESMAEAMIPFFTLSGKLI